MLGQLVHNRYEIKSLVGAGGMGLVYKAYDRHEQCDVALKVFRLGPHESLALDLFKNEFRVLAGLAHPNISRVHEFGRVSEENKEQPKTFMVADFVEGTDLLTATEGLTLDKIYPLAVQIARALGYLTGRGIVHGDLKPGNILVHDGELKLLDFGLASGPFNRQGFLLGTPAYMAPEVIRQEPFDHRADLYSLGIVLFRLVTRRLPFEADTSQTLMDLQISLSPPSPRSLVPEIPEALDRLILSLLCKDPRRRPFHASQVIAMLAAIAGEDWKAQSDEQIEAPPLKSARIGRRDDLQRLKHAADDRLSSQPQGTAAALIIGEEGMGKTLLLRELRHALAVEDVATIYTSAADFSAPFELTRSLFIQCAGIASVEQRKPLQEWIHGLFQFSATETAMESNPDLRTFTLCERFLEILQRALQEATTQNLRGLALFIDDLDAAPPEDFDVITCLFRSLAQMKPAAAVFATAAANAAVMKRPEYLQRMLQDSAVEMLKLTGIDEQALRTWLLAAGVKAAVLPWLTPRLLEISSGNPFVVHEILKDLQMHPLWEQGLSLSPAEWDRWITELRPPHTVRDILRGLLVTLSGDERRLLAVLALAGEPLEAEALTAVCRVNVDATLSSLRWRGILQPVIQNQRSTYRFANPLLPHLFLEGRDISSEAAQVHSDLAKWLETQPHSPLQRRARHLIEAGPSPAAFHAAIAAGDRAALETARHTAVWFYEKALDMRTALSTDDLTPQLAAVCRYLSQLYRYLGRFTDALATLETAAALEPNRNLEWTRRRGEILQVTGKPHDALKALDQVLAHAAVRDEPAEYFQAVWLKARCLYALGDYAGMAELTGRALDEMTGFAHLEEVKPALAHLRVNQGLSFFYLGNYDQARQSFEQALVVFSTLNRRAESTFAVNALGMVYFREGRTPEALIEFKQAYKIAKEVCDLRLLVNFAMNIGAIYHDQKDYDLALDHYEEALTLSRRIGHDNETAKVLNNIANLRIEFGDFESAAAAAHESLHITRKNSLLEIELYNLMALAACALETQNPLDAVTHLQAAAAIAKTQHFREKEAHCLQGLAESFVMLGDFAQARRTLLLAQPMVEALTAKSRHLEQVYAWGKLHRGEGDFTKAEENLAQAAVLADEIVDLRQLWNIRFDQGLLAQAHGAPADDFFEQARDLFEDYCRRVPAAFQHHLRNSRRGRELLRHYPEGLP